MHGCAAFDAVGRAEGRYIFKVSGLSEYLLHADWSVKDYHWVAIARRKQERVRLELERLDDETLIKLAPKRAMTFEDMQQQLCRSYELCGEFDESGRKHYLDLHQTANLAVSAGIEEAGVAPHGKFDNEALPSIQKLIPLSSVPSSIAWHVLVQRVVHCPDDLPCESLEVELRLFNADDADGEFTLGTGVRSRKEPAAPVTAWVPCAVLEHPHAIEARTLPRSARLVLTVCALGANLPDEKINNDTTTKITSGVQGNGAYSELTGASLHDRLPSARGRTAIAQIVLPILDESGLLRIGATRLHLWPSDAVRAARTAKRIKATVTRDTHSPNISNMSAGWSLVGENPRRDSGALDVTFMLNGIARSPIFADDAPTAEDLFWTKRNQNAEKPLIELDRLCYRTNQATDADVYAGDDSSIDNFATLHKNLQPFSIAPCLESHLWIGAILHRKPLRPLSRTERGSLWECRKNTRLVHEVLPVWWLSIPRPDREALVEARFFVMCHWWRDTSCSNFKQDYCGTHSTQTRIALECIRVPHADGFTRAYACQILSGLADETLFDILPQLTQTLKYEPQHDSAIARLLIRRAACSPLSLGHRFFWLLRSEMHVPGIAERYGVFLYVFLSSLGSDFCDRLDAECKLDEILSDVAARVKRQPTRAKRQLCAQRWLTAANHALKNIEVERQRRFAKRLGVSVGATATVRNAWNAIRGYSTCLNPVLRCTSIRVKQCKVLASKKLPLYIVFKNCDWRGDDFHVIFKSGDDLRQDQLTLQLVRLMDGLWRDAGLDLQMCSYGCVATSQSSGMIEVVPSATTTADIQVQYGGGAKGAFNDQVVASFLLHHNQDAAKYERARHTFLKTCAGYCVATHVLGIGDRHADNIMVTKGGKLFHIDFGHFLGNFKSKYGVRRERSPFVFTPEMKRVLVHTPEQILEQIKLFREIGSGRDNTTPDTSLGYTQFEHLCTRAYNVYPAPPLSVYDSLLL